MSNIMPVFLSGIAKVPISMRFVVGAEQVVAIITVVSFNHGYAGKMVLLTGVWLAVFWLISNLW